MNSLLLAREMTIGEGLINAVIGFAVVFVVLFIIYVIIIAFGKLFSMKKKPAAAAAEPAPIPAESAKAPVATDVDDQTLALIIAILAKETGIAPERLCIDSVKRIEG